MRTIVDLPEKQITALTALCEVAHLSRAEAIRRAVAYYLAHNALEEEDTAFGTWKDVKEDSVALQRKLRTEWAS